MARPIYILNGPNLNLLGTREPDIYGASTLDDIKALCSDSAHGLGCEIEFRQTNVEGELVTWVQEAADAAAGVIVNAAAYTHTSVALLDALKTCTVPVVEVHLSNVYKREPFRHNSYVSPAATGVICGFGPHGYVLALEAIAKLIAGKQE